MPPLSTESTTERAFGSSFGTSTGWSARAEGYPTLASSWLSWQDNVIALYNCKKGNLIFLQNITNASDTQYGTAEYDPCLHNHCLRCIFKRISYGTPPPPKKRKCTCSLKFLISTVRGPMSCFAKWKPGGFSAESPAPKIRIMIILQRLLIIVKVNSRSAQVFEDTLRTW